MAEFAENYINPFTDYGFNPDSSGWRRAEQYLLLDFLNVLLKKNGVRSGDLTYLKGELLYCFQIRFPLLYSVGLCLPNLTSISTPLSLWLKIRFSCNKVLVSPNGLIRQKAEGVRAVRCTSI